MNTSLYIIANEFADMINRLNSGDYDEQTIADTIEAESGAFNDKAISVAMYIRNLEASAEQIKLAEKDMAERRKAIENKAASLKQYLFDAMKRVNVPKVDSAYFAVTIKKNPAKLVIDDAGAIPSDLYIYPAAPDPYPDNAKIKDMLKAGGVVNGARLQQDERIEIK